MNLDSHVVVQVSVIVKDIEKTAKTLSQLFGMEMPNIFSMDELGETYAEFTGDPTDANIKIANFPMGGVTLELIEPDKNPSTFRTFLEENGEGLHHFGVMVDDKEQALKTLEEQDIPIRYWGTYPGGAYYIADTRSFFGTLLNVKHED